MLSVFQVGQFVFQIDAFVCLVFCWYQRATSCRGTSEVNSSLLNDPFGFVIGNELLKSPCSRPRSPRLGPKFPEGMPWLFPNVPECSREEGVSTNRMKCFCGTKACDRAACAAVPPFLSGARPPCAEQFFRQRPDLRPELLPLHQFLRVCTQA